MPKRKFQATEGLLNDVMRKQSGVIQKAWLEAVMNGVDANADHISLEITEDTTRYSDNGDNMVEEEIKQYFEQFGLKDGDIEDKQFGKFRMGRGQIFNFGLNIWRAKDNYMVVSLDDESTTAVLPDCTTETDESIIGVDGDNYTLDTSGLGYTLLDADTNDSGVNIEVQHYNDIDDLQSTLDEFIQLIEYVPWMHDVTIELNGEDIGSEPEVVDETKLAYFCEGYTNYKTSSPVYNLGAYVDDFNLGELSLAIISKEDLDVTLDRTDILEHDQKWQKICEQYVEVAVGVLSDRDNLNTRKRNWLIERASEETHHLDTLQDVPLIEDANNDIRTLSEIQGRNVAFAETDNEIAQKAMQEKDVVVIDEAQESSINELADSMADTVDQDNVRSFSEVIEQELNFEMDEVPDQNLSKRRLQNLEILRDALLDLGFSDDVFAGYSNHKSVWKHKDGTIYIHKDKLNAKQQDLATDIIFEVIKVAAHSGETMTSFNENYDLNRGFYKMATGSRFGADVDMPTVQKRILNGTYK